MGDARVPNAGPQLRLVNPENQFEMARYDGLLPRASIDAIERLDPRFELPYLYVVVGRFRATRIAIGLVRDLHLFTANAPRAAASGTYSFQEFDEADKKLVDDLMEFRRRLNGDLTESGIRLPRVPRGGKERRSHAA